MTYFLADQRPHWSQIHFWTRFFNQDSPFFTGAEKIARKFNAAVVYLKVTPVKRGYYEAEFVLVEEEAVNTKEHEITERYVQLLENHIREAPEYWLWTHKRWKYTKPPETQDIT
jgi:KDO2-lipid IV(A) lauroyltransferase